MIALRKRSPTFLVTLAIVSAVAAALVHVYVHLAIIHVGYDLAREAKVKHELAEQNQKLRLELEMRKDPSVIERRAREELHMAPPDPGAIRVIRVGQSGPLAVRSK